MNRSENQCVDLKIWVTLIFCKLNQLKVQIKVVFLRRYAFGFNFVHMYQEKKTDVYIKNFERSNNLKCLQIEICQYSQSKQIHGN